MAVERIKEFTLNLGNLVNTRMENFDLMKTRVRAESEAEFQRTVMDNDLTAQDQLEYREQQLERENKKTFPDSNFISELKSSVTQLKKMAKERRFRDKYFSLLEELASGSKSLDDHLQFLKTQMTDSWSQEIKDDLQAEIIKVGEAKLTRDRQIIDSEISFNQRDNTAQSLSKASGLIKKQLLKNEIQKDPALKTAYELQLQSLEKQQREVAIEDKLHWTAVENVKTERTNPSLWKLEVFGGYKDGGDITGPVNVGGVRYESEQAYWAVTQQNYIANTFATEYANENKNQATLLWNKVGQLPDSFLKKLVDKNQNLRSHTDLIPYENVVTSAIQDSITHALSLRAKDLQAKYRLNTPNIATERDYEQAKQELVNLKSLFGEEYSLSPEINSIETMLIEKKYARTQSILEGAGALAEAEGISIEEAIKKVGPVSEIEVPAADILKQTPTETAQQVTKETKAVPKLVKQKQDLEQQVSETRKKVEAQQKAQGVKPTTTPKPKPKPTPTHTPTPTPTPTPAPTPALKPTGYTGPSIVDYLKSVGKPSGYPAREALAKAQGITRYRGSGPQNDELLKKLRGS